MACTTGSQWNSLTLVHTTLAFRTCLVQCASIIRAHAAALLWKQKVHAERVPFFLLASEVKISIILELYYIGTNHKVESYF